MRLFERGDNPEIEESQRELLGLGAGQSGSAKACECRLDRGSGQYNSHQRSPNKHANADRSINIAMGPITDLVARLNLLGRACCGLVLGNQVVWQPFLEVSDRCEEPIRKDPSGEDDKARASRDEPGAEAERLIAQTFSM